MTKRSLLSLILVLCLFGIPLTVCAESASDTTEIKISNVSDFLLFAQNCRLDVYSNNVTVQLIADIDLEDHEFTGIPVFNGTFHGNGHKISGLSISDSGSNKGLFRYLAANANVHDLHVSGTVTPSGSAAYTGGIAGRNKGSISGCSFTGTVAGSDCVGGIAGINESTGIIRDCVITGIVYGNHFVGGMTGNNAGLIQGCRNIADVNADPQQNSVDISDITIENITGSESAATATDIGGITGLNNGYLSDCSNEGKIGYPHIGYNVGGISGCSNGYISGCNNSGVISGRKDVGGIAGQLEPVLTITYATDAVQQLQHQMNTLSGIINRTSYHLNTATDDLKQQINLLRGELLTIQDILQGFDPNNKTLEDIPETLQELQTSYDSVNHALKQILTSVENTSSALVRDLQTMSQITGNMQQILSGVSDHLGGTVYDASDEDTDNNITCKISECINYTSVQADRNGGGIVGTVGIENDLDHEEDITVLGDSSLNFTGSFRAVITGCQNYAQLSVKKQYGGGIVGYATMGLIRSCTFDSYLDCPSADYVGGIAGRSDGSIRNCFARSLIHASNYVGGISGYGAKISDCVSLSHISGIECIGGISGHAETNEQITANVYLPTALDPGAIDGISYVDHAQPISLTEFVELPDLPDQFLTYTITFRHEEESETVIIKNIGQSITSSEIPDIPHSPGLEGVWNMTDALPYFDYFVECTYSPVEKIVQSDQLRDNGLPVILISGTQTVPTITQEAISPDSIALECWNISEIKGLCTVRYLPAQSFYSEDLAILIQNSAGEWIEAETHMDGSYIVFSHQDTETVRFRVTIQTKAPWLAVVIGCAVLLFVSTAVFLIANNHRKKKSTRTKTAAE